MIIYCYVQHVTLQSQTTSIGVAEIFSAVHFFGSQKSLPVLVVALRLKTQPKHTKYSTPTL